MISRFAYRSWLSRTSVRLPNRASASSNSRIAPLRLGGVEDAAQVLLRLADVLADDAGEVDPVEVEAQVRGDDLGGHRLAGPARPREQGGDAAAATELGPEPPGLVDAAALLDLVGELAQLRADVGVDDDVVPAPGGLDPARELVEPGPGLRPARVPQAGAGDAVVVAAARRGPRSRRSPPARSRTAGRSRRPRRSPSSGRFARAVCHRALCSAAGRAAGRRPRRGSRCRGRASARH